MGRVLDKFAAVPVSEAKDGTLQKLVGRVVLAGSQPFYAPGSGRPAVWYRVEVFEERVRMQERTDAEGNVSHVEETFWESICKVRSPRVWRTCAHVHTLDLNPDPRRGCHCHPQDEKFIDFYIQVTSRAHTRAAVATPAVAFRAAN